MRPRLSALAAAHPVIGDVRGRGAMLAIELVVPGSSGPLGPVPDAGGAAAVARACHDAGLLVLTCGTYGNVIRFLPPLVISDDELERGLAILDAAF
jgi:4-aminobutyrate aminotransferase/(S)-3-amino-2-methylpropionate transaminase